MHAVWAIGAAGYYSALVIWILAQRTHHFHGRYSHSWMIGVLLLIFSGLQIVGSLDSWMVSIGAVSLIMPITVTSMDLYEHRTTGRALLEHKPDCWMLDKTSAHRHPHRLDERLNFSV